MKNNCYLCIIYLRFSLVVKLYQWFIFISEKGVCFPTVVLWLLFVYMEAAVRLRDLRHLPFHLDLCRPFAAHWYMNGLF